MSDDGRRLAAAFNDLLLIWDLENGKPLTDPINCGAGISRLAFAENSSSEVRATLSDGSAVAWRTADVPEKLSTVQVEALGALAKAVAEYRAPTKLQSLGELHDSNLDLLVSHFVKSSVSSQMPAGDVHHVIKNSSDAVITFWLKAGGASNPPEPDSEVVRGLQRVSRSSPENKKLVDQLCETWKRLARSEIELNLVGTALKLPGHYEDLRLSTGDSIKYLEAALTFDNDNPVLLSRLAYLGTLDLKQENGGAPQEKGGEAQTPETEDKANQAIANWKRQAENSLVQKQPGDPNDPEQAGIERKSSR